MKNIAVSFEPSPEQLTNIENWLIKESKTSKPGFYVNWKNSVLVSNSRGLMSILLLDNNPIGFMTWYQGENRVGEIVIAEIKPRFRKKGYGKILLYALLDKLKSNGIYVVTLHCQPATSETAWKKLGFIQFPDIRAFSDKNSDQGKRLYKILIPSASLVSVENAPEIIQLWSTEPRENINELPKWAWPINFIDDGSELKLPIIFPAKNSWQLRWSRNNVIIKEDGIKYFQSGELDQSDFLIIDHLNLPQTKII